MATLLQDFRFALRTLSRSWVISLLALVSLSLAIAGNGVVFSMINGLLFRPLPFEDAENLLILWSDRQGQPPPANFTLLSPAEVVDYRERATLLSGLHAFAPSGVSWTESERPEQLVAERVTVGMFPFLGAPAAKGRTFAEGESRENVVILPHRFWQERLGSREGVLGSTLRLNSEPYTVIGVMPEGFEIFTPGVDLWLPMKLDEEDLSREQRALFAFARAKPGVSLGEAAAEVEAISKRLAEEYPQSNRGYRGVLERFRDRIPDENNRILFGMLQGALLFVLLIACANIANLLLARGYDREREFAVRRAMGAGRLRILRQLLSESLFLSLSGGALGLLLAYVGIRLTSASFGSLLPSFYAPVLDWRVLLFTLAVTVAGGIVFGVAPALQGSRVDLVSSLKEGARGGGGGSRKLVSKGLVVAEVTLAVVLLAGAGLLIKSFSDLKNTESGIDSENLLTMNVSLPGRYQDADKVRFFEQAIERLEALPGVDSATVANNLPRSPFVINVPFELDARPASPGQLPPSAIAISVPPNYFETLGIPILRGRGVQRGDREDTDHVAVVSQAMAEHYWPGDDPLGRRLTIFGESRRVVGVAGNILQSFVQLGTGPQAVVYLPQAQEPRSAMFFLLRARGGPGALSDLARREITALDRDLSISQVRTLDAFIEQFFAGVDVFNATLSFAGVLALLLASVGIYGVLAYSVAQRRHEIGVRMAMGADRRRVLRLVVRQGAFLAAIGFVLALPGVLLVHNAIAQLLAGISDVDPAPVPIAIVTLAAVVAAACYIPARRAAGTDPILALRGE